MKNLPKLLIILLFPVSVFAAKDTTIVNGVIIETNYNQSIFPEEWQGGTINATGEQMTFDEARRAEPIMIKALKKYPKSLLALTLRAVYLVKSMQFFNVGFGGTNSSDAVYVTDDGDANGYTDFYIEQTFHHEYSSILFRGYARFLDTIAWKQQNDPGFGYNDPEAGVGAIKNKKSSQNLDTELAEKGMLTQYAMSSLENDINTFAQNLFRPEKNFWSFVDKYPRVGKKVKLLIEFYAHLSPMFTEQYFRSFDASNN